jgi:starch synthase (maltosyl-transferring)
LGTDYGGQYFAPTKIDTKNQIIAIFVQIHSSQRQEKVASLLIIILYTETDNKQKRQTPVNKQRQIPIIYNLFPRLTGTMSDWLPHASRAAEMGFNWLYINSILFPGFSGSLYAVKHHYRINPQFLPPHSKTDGLGMLAHTLRGFRKLGLWPMMDLVINHTSRDCPLISEHPGWYVHDHHGAIVSPFAGDPDDPGKVTVWGDLAEIDNEGSTDRKDLWAYWAELVKRYLQLGFKGFRCDAAYKIPVDEAARIDPETMFFAETLGCAEEEALALHDAGLHYFFNSSKWWDFKEPWALEQHRKFGRIAPSISFPESHDTTRLAADTGGNEAVQRQRYAFAVSFSAGLMMPIGYEFGFKKKLDVVSTRPADWETATFDIRGFVKQVNALKIQSPLLQCEGGLNTLISDRDALVLERRSQQAPGQKGWILMNKSTDRRTAVSFEGIALTSRHRLHRVCRSDGSSSPEVPISPHSIVLDPAEVILLLES